MQGDSRFCCMSFARHISSRLDFGECRLERCFFAHERSYRQFAEVLPALALTSRRKSFVVGDERSPPPRAPKFDTIASEYRSGLLNDEAISLPTRRSVLRGIGAVTCAGIAANAQPTVAAVETKPSASFFPILRQPDAVRPYAEDPNAISLRRSGSDWTQESLRFTCKESSDSLQLTLSAPDCA